MIALIAAACSDRPIELGAEAGTRVIVERAPFAIRIFDAAGKEILTTYPAENGAYGTPATTIDRFEEVSQLIPGWDGYRPREGAWNHVAQISVRAESAHESELELLDAQGGSIGVLKISVAGARVRILITGEQTNKMSLSFAAKTEERYFGMGERYASVDHRGLSLYSWAEEGGLGKGESAAVAADNPYPNGPSMTYFPLAFFISSEGYAFRLHNTHRSELHFASEVADAWRVAVNGDSIEATIYVEPDPLKAIDLSTEDTGRPLVPAPWVFGPRRRVGLGSRVDGVEEYKALRQRGVPTTALDDAVHFLPHRSELGREAELIAWTSTIHAMGYKAMAYYNPFVSESLETAQEDFRHGVENGYFVKTKTGETGLAVLVSGELQNVASVDFTNPAARAWYDEILMRGIRLGYDGWMHDFGEYIGRDWVFSDGRRGDEMHNLYPVLSAMAAREVLQREKPDDHLFFVRSGYAGTQAYAPAVWGGDPEATFDHTQGLPAALRGGINLGISGVPYWGSDISGFKCFTDEPRDKEVYLRWAQVGAVSPIMMDQNACVAATGRREKWTLWSDAETVEVYGKMARLHTRMQPYFLVLAKESNRSGAPIMRHPFLMHPRVPEVWSIDDAFFLGPALYAAPVVKRGERVKSTWLPPGTYVDLDDHRVYAGGQRAEIPAPLEKLPLLLVEGQILPLLDPSIETLAPATAPEVITVARVKDLLDVLVALAPGSRAELTLVDGTVLEARREDAGGGGGEEVLDVATPETISSCAGCVLIEETGDVSRVRASSRAEKTTRLRVEDLVLEAKGPEARRIRWDVSRVRD